MGGVARGMWHMVLILMQLFYCLIDLLCDLLSFKHLFSSVYANCTSAQFKCNNGECIDEALRCNLLDDCVDGSDERECGKDFIVQTCLGFVLTNHDILKMFKYGGTQNFYILLDRSFLTE